MEKLQERLKKAKNATIKMLNARLMELTLLEKKYRQSKSEFNDQDKADVMQGKNVRD